MSSETNLNQKNTNNSLTPPLKWAGGKRWIIPYLQPLWEKSERTHLTEPFTGSLSVGLFLKPHYGLYNDINPHLINFYQQIKKGFTLSEFPWEQKVILEKEETNMINFFVSQKYFLSLKKIFNQNKKEFFIAVKEKIKNDFKNIEISDIQRKSLIESFSSSEFLNLIWTKTQKTDINEKELLNILLKDWHQRTNYAHQRNIFNKNIIENNYNNEQSAAIFYYLNRTGFNGLCRFNKSGLFNVPFGRNKKINYKLDFLEYKKSFSKWKFTCQNYKEIAVNKNTFLYCDPPYDTPFTQYSKEEFGWTQQIELIEWLGQYKNPTVISNQATSRIISLYKENNLEYIILDAPRRISSNGNRENAKEILAWKNI